jgi:tRNA threonylcarbamoyladenosine biosynthesis protein TsaE
VRRELQTRDAEETVELGRRLAGFLLPGDVLGLSGDLGSGKTTFVRGLAAGLGSTDRVVSPSFILVAEYAGRIPLLHLDLYRLKTEKELLELGLPDLLSGEGAAAVEWCERWGSLAPSSWLEVRFRMDPAARGLHHLSFALHGPTWQERGPRIEALESAALRDEGTP